MNPITNSIKRSAAKLLAFLVLSSIAGTLYGQSPGDSLVDPISILMDRLDAHQRLRPQEKLYLHLEKEVHSEGEHLWFSLYLVAGTDHIPSPISTGAFVKLLAPNGEVVKEMYVKVNRGAGYGDIEVSPDWPKGTYTLKAYTEWMRNFDWEYQPEHKVILNQETENAKSDNACEIEFYPEGGNWIAGLSQRMAFIAGTNEASGTIYDSEKQQVAEFSTSEKGLGSVTLEAESGKSYFATLAGCEAQFPLPKVQPEGIVLKANKMGNRFIRLDIKSASEDWDGKTLNALVQSRGKVFSSLSLQINGDRARAIIPMAELSAGISQVVLFDENLKLLAERLVFVGGRENVKVNAVLDAADKSQLVMNLTFKQDGTTPIPGRFSAALFTEEPSALSNSIEGYINLESELTGLTHSRRYFSDATPMADATIDLLMMTRKWTWFNWRDIRFNRMVAVDKTLNTYMNEAYVERQQFDEDEDAITSLDANAKRLDDVVVTAEKEEENIAVKSIYGKGNGGSLDLDEMDVNSNENFLDVIRGRIAGVYVKGTGDQTTINIRGSVAGTGGNFTELPPLILLNDIPTEIDMLIDLPAQLIKSIEVFKGAGASLFGVRGSGGVIAVYTRFSSVPPRRTRESRPGNKEEAEKPMEYAKAADFDTKKTTSTQLAHWAPVTVINSEGKASITFQKPGQDKPLYLRIQGIAQNGVPFSEVVKVR